MFTLNKFTNVFFHKTINNLHEILAIGNLEKKDQTYVKYML